MANEKAKLLLESSSDYFDRISAVQQALRMGMSLEEIEEYLDWIKLLRNERMSLGAEQPSQTE
ncbi:MAG: hypothetical protein WD045_09260 [Pirellulaceae bacterium]